ncbi:MAG: GHKL domain-containing protein [Lachnospiraceae bacterium]|nr:GHKL domain-containing protein [Lachnospiraceae bacterium]
MEKILLMILNVLTIVEWLSFCHIVLNRRRTKPRLLITFLGVVVTIALVGSIILQCWDSKLCYLLIFLIIYNLFSENLIEAIKTYFLTYAILVVLEGCIMCVIKVYSSELESKTIMAIMCVGIILFFLWGYYLLIGRKLDRNHLKIPKRVWKLFVGILCALILMMTYFVFVLECVSDVRMVKVGSVLILVGGIAICGMIVAVIYYFNGVEKYRLQSEMSEKYNEQQREYFIKLLEKEQDTRKFRHDIINHLMAMSDLADRGEQIGLQRYLDDLLMDINNEKNQYYDVGNSVVNTILNYYLLPVKEMCTITVEGYMSEKAGLSQKDLCTIFSNIIRNAVDAIEDLETEKRIEITINQGERFLNITVENTTEREIIFDGEGLPQTSHNDKQNHGLGLKNVKQVVQNYNGSYKFNVEKDSFITEIYLPI